LKGSGESERDWLHVCMSHLSIHGDLQMGTENGRLRGG
jgi:hypothetical protein